MKLLVFFSVCLVAINARELLINNNGYYWRDWNLQDPIPVDAIPGGIDKAGHRTFIAKTILYLMGVIVPGKACPVEQKMWYEHGNTEYVATRDVFILCSLNHKRFYWIPTKRNGLISDVEKDQKVLVIGGGDSAGRNVIGRKVTDTEIKTGKVLVNDVTNQFLDLKVTERSRGFTISDSYEVLVMDKKPDDCNNVIVELPENN